MLTGSPQRSALRCLLILALLLAGTAVAGSTERGLLWRIERGGETVGHLFGTIHSDRPEVLDLPAPVERAFRDARLAVFEVDARRVERAEIARLMRYRDGSSLPEHLSPRLWQRVRAAAEQRGLPRRALRGLEPWAAATLLALPPTDPDRVLDTVLQQRALARGVPVEGLESVAEQLAVFDRLEPERQLEMLRAAVDAVESGTVEAQFEQMLDAWKARDLDRLVALADANPALTDPIDNGRLMDELLDARNRRMVERLQPHLDAGGVFIAVGALHLPGEDGLIRLLERRGYELRPVY